MKVERLDHINMSVADFEQSAAWYQHVFGFEVVERGVREGRPWGVLRSGQAMLCIYERPSLSAPVKPWGRANHGMSHFAFAIADPSAWEHKLAELEIPLLYGGRTDWPHSTAWYVNDPTGYEIEVAHWKDENQFAA